MQLPVMVRMGRKTGSPSFSWHQRYEPKTPSGIKTRIYLQEHQNTNRSVSHVFLKLAFGRPTRIQLNAWQLLHHVGSSNHVTQLNKKIASETMKQIHDQKMSGHMTVLVWACL